MAEKGPLFGGAPGEDVNEWIAVVNIQFLSLKLAELEIVDSLVWALCVSAYQYNIYNHVWLLMPLPLI